MKKYFVVYAIIAVFALLTFNTKGNCFAGADDIKARMQERLPTVVQLKSEGIVGENNMGFLEFVPGAAIKMQDIVGDENKDRKMVYEAIGRQQNTTAELVGKRRAIQIAERAVPGEWLQDGSGKWYKK
ncbi:MAG: YdbL family protein [Deltaproteobacteria bacterium]|jgi:uncharacterized protein YdbL (DUF1318 family)|nr:YdbL family protein [Deltaproteobacteria bacterium]MBW2485759.1 YdbL family protein [Deltaproteobacteria bacterium]